MKRDRRPLGAMVALLDLQLERVFAVLDGREAQAGAGSVVPGDGEPAGVAALHAGLRRVPQDDERAVCGDAEVLKAAEHRHHRTFIDLGSTSELEGVVAAVYEHQLMAGGGRQALGEGIPQRAGFDLPAILDHQHGQRTARAIPILAAIFLGEVQTTGEGMNAAADFARRVLIGHIDELGPLHGATEHRQAGMDREPELKAEARLAGAARATQECRNAALNEARHQLGHRFLGPSANSAPRDGCA